jgi:hypothetical protein
VIYAFWDPKSKRLFNDQPFGVGWAVNVPAALALIAGLRQRAWPPAPRRKATTRSKAPTKAAEA